MRTDKIALLTDSCADIPVEVAKRFKRAGIVNPYRCEQLERDLYRNAEQKGDGDGKAKKKKT